MSPLPEHHPFHRLNLVRPGGRTGCRAAKQLAAMPESVAAVRRWTDRVLTAWSVPGESTGTAVQIMSELATNSVTHTSSTRIIACAARTADSVTVGVIDRGRPGTAIHPRFADPDDEHGRGLAYIAQAADDWGTGALRAGTCVWARLNFPVPWSVTAESAVTGGVWWQATVPHRGPAQAVAHDVAEDLNDTLAVQGVDPAVRNRLLHVQVRRASGDRKRLRSGRPEAVRLPALTPAVN